MDRVASQLLRALRGRRSQVALARRLGYRANPITDWEHGRRYPTAQQTLRAAARVGKDVSLAFSRFTPRVPLRARAGVFDLAGWLRLLVGHTAIAELARSTGHSRSSITRWLSGRSDPRLPDFLQLVDAVTGRLPDLVAELVPIAEVPALSARFSAMQAARRLAFDEPWTEAILRLLETQSYAALEVAKPGWLATRLGIDVADETRCMNALARTGVVHWDGQRYRAQPLSVDTYGGQHGLRQLRRHWALVAGERALTPQPGDWLAYNVISVNEPDLERIRELLVSTFREARAMVAQSEPPQCAALLNMHLISWHDPSDRGQR